MKWYRPVLVLSALALAATGCTSSPSRIDTPPAAQPTNGNAVGPTKVQYSNNAPAQPGSQNMAATTGNATGSSNNTAYRNTNTPSLPKMTMTSSQERAMRDMRTDVNLFESYNRNLPWNSGSSPFGYRTPSFSSGVNRGRR